jgi:adenine-specific DNA-methyltransferase
MAALENDELVIAKKNGRWSVNYKQYLKDESGTVRGAKPFSILEGPYTQIGTAELARLFGDQKIFPFPKPSALIARLIQYAHPSNSFIVLDFFAGSGSTFEAVLRLNKDDSGRRRFISVQVPEPTGRDDFATIADITKERVRRVGTELKEKDGLVVGDVGFRVFKLDASNIRAWTPDRDDIEATLLDNVEHIRAGRNEDDILYELLLKLGLDLCVPIETRAIAGKTVRSVGAGTLIACLAESIASDEVEPLGLGIADWHADLEPAGDSTVVFRDSAFADDVAKTNLTAILEQRGLGNVRSL